MEYEYKIRIGSEVYSSKKGMVIKWYTLPKSYTRIESAIVALKDMFPTNRISFEKGKNNKGTIYRYPNGVASHKKFKVMRIKLK